MTDRRDVIWEQRNALERIIQSIPGFRGYYGAENRRQADAELRRFGVARLDRVIGALHDAIKRAPLEEIEEPCELLRQVEKLRNELRFADQGYAGFFSEIKWDRDEILDAIYERDEQIIEGLLALATAVESGDWRASDLRQEVRALQRAVAERRDSILSSSPDADFGEE